METRRKIYRYLQLPQWGKVQLYMFIRIASLKADFNELGGVPCDCKSHNMPPVENQAEDRKSLSARNASESLVSSQDGVVSMAAPKQLQQAEVGQSFAAVYDISDVQPVEQRASRNSLIGMVERGFYTLRIFTTLWMIFIIIRYYLIGYMDTYLKLHYDLQRPLNCYLAGHFIIAENMADITATMMAVAHLFWRFFHLLHKPYFLDAVHFVSMEESDLAAFYASLNKNQSISLTISEADRLCSKKRWLLNMMCFKISTKTKVTYKLRCNRTRLIRDKLFQAIANVTMVGVTSFLSIFMFLAPSVAFAIIFDRRYLRVYRNCDPELQKREAELPWYSISWTIHRCYSACLDAIENFTLWLEGGLLCFFGPGFVAVVNYDVSLCWSCIERKINLLSSLVRHGSVQRTVAINRYSVIGKPNRYESKIYELFSEIVDFFEQVHRADALVRDFLGCALISWLFICAMYTYISQVNSIRNLPINIIMMMTFFVTVISIPCLGLLNLHKNCMRTYTKFCSIMAHDPGKHEHNYGIILEMYVRRRCCYTVMGQFQFVPTTFLTAVGWTCSCFCLVTAMLRNQHYVPAPSF